MKKCTFEAANPFLITHSQEKTKHKAGCGAHSYNSSAKGEETGGSLGLAS